MLLASIFQPRPLAIAVTLAFTTLSAVAAEAVSYDQLDSELKILLRKLEAANEDAIAFREANPVIVTAGDKGFGLSSADKNFDLKLRGFIQTDARYFDQGIQGRFDNNLAGDRQLEPVDNFLVRRARINIEGTVYGKYGFRITPDFAGNAVTLADAYVDANWLPQFKVRAGKFRPQVEIERTQGSPDYKFNETSLVTNFIPTRDVGVQISGDFAGNTLNYNIAYVNGANDGASGPNADVDTDKEIQARLLYSPFGIFQGLTVGLGGTTNDTQGSTVLTTLSSYRTAGQESFFQYDANVFGDGRRTRLIPQASYFTGNFGVFAEYIKEKQEVTLATTPAAATDRSNIGLEHDGWSITAAWTITGEEQSLKNIKPLQDFNPSKGGAGAWELVFRAGELSLDEETFKGADGNVGSAGRFADARRNAQKAESVGVGVNWYLNKVVKVAVNYEDTGFTGGGGGNAANPEDRADERVLIGRVQANW